ncbi:MAG: type II and III secretion system protein family protein [Methyloligellaceae bacterium]
MWKTFRNAWAFFAVFAAILIYGLAAVPVGQGAMAQSAHQSFFRLPAGVQHPVTRRVTIGLHKSMVVELPREVRDVLVSNPKNLDAVVQGSKRVYLIANQVGQANAFFFDKSGEQILTLEVTIERDLGAITAMLHRLVPGSRIKLEAVNDNVVISGSVVNAADASRATDLVSRLVEEREKVLNMLSVESREQVFLKVTVAEMQRNVIKQLGVDLGELNALNFVTTGNFNLFNLTDLAFPFNDKDIVSTALKGFRWQTTDANGNVRNRIQAIIRALEQDGIIRTLAEPTLTAISGETASFLAGGEFPIPIAQDDSSISVEFKPFGVGLSFTPLVMSEGRISLKISSEVSELTNDAAITLGTLSIPGLKVRRAETTIELPSGGSLAIAGLISNETQQAMTGYPGLKDIPVLGALFRSRDFKRSETELVIIVQPFVVNPVARNKLVRPDRGFALPTDLQANLLGRLNRVYGTRPERMPVGSYKGDVGYIIE